MRTLIIILSIHIFSVQTKLLYLLNGGSDQFSYLNITEQTILAMVFSVSYSVATALILYKSKNTKLILLYALLDGLAVLLYYFIRIPIEVSAFYFAIYTFVMIASTLALGKKPVKKKYSQSALARELGVSRAKLFVAINKIKK